MSSGDKCVYLHKDNNGVVRYVGSGTIERAHLTRANSGRGERYAAFVEENGKLIVKIVAKGLTKLEAENLERNLYDEHKATIFNVNRPSSAKTMTKEMFQEHLYYDETSKSCLRWKTDRISGNHGSVRMKANSEAGCFNKSSGYYQVNLQGKRYLAHRIVCVLHDLEVEGMVIDHTDRNRSNNRISNIRVVSQKENMQNLSQHKLSSRNTSGFQGVKYNKYQDHWVASWSESGKRKFKYFPIKNYASSEEAFLAACEYRNQMVELHYQNN